MCLYVPKGELALRLRKDQKDQSRSEEHIRGVLNNYDCMDAIFKQLADETIDVAAENVCSRVRNIISQRQYTVASVF